jgi:hypothetical protein
MLKEKANEALSDLQNIAQKDFDNYLEGLTILTKAPNETKNIFVISVT